MATLHLTRNLPALIPRYVTRFSCIGSACEDSCCVGWNVALDKKTYKAYRKSTHPELSRLLKDSVKRQRSQVSDINYGRIEMEAGSQACPLMVDSLCAVQAKLNETYLSNTCFTYPRVSREVGGQFEQSLLLSCPEAARQALLAPDAFDFIEGTIAVRVDLIHPVARQQGISVEMLSQLRVFCLNLFRAEGLELWQRLALLGVFCESLSAKLAAHEHESIPALMDAYAGLVQNGQVAAALGDLQPNHTAQAMVFSTLWGGKDFVSTSQARNKMVDLVSRGLGADERSGKVSREDLVNNYTRGVTRLPDALKAAPHLLEHYLVNEIFSNFFPFDQGTPYDNFLRLVSRFGVLRLMLAAQCALDGPLPDAAQLVATVQTHCRRFQHDPLFAIRINESMKNSGLDGLDKLYGFLRA